MSERDHTVDGLLLQIEILQSRCAVKDVSFATLLEEYKKLRREVAFRDDRIRKVLALPCFDGVRGAER